MSRECSIVNGQCSVSRGFTLVEMLIVLAGITLMTVAIVGIFISSIRASRKAQVVTEVKQNGDYAMGVMTRALRNATEVVACTGSAPKPCKVINRCSTLYPDQWGSYTPTDLENCSGVPTGGDCLGSVTNPGSPGTPACITGYNLGCVCRQTKVLCDCSTAEGGPGCSLEAGQDVTPRVDYLDSAGKYGYFECADLDNDHTIESIASGSASAKLNSDKVRVTACDISCNINDPRQPQTVKIDFTLAQAGSGNVYESSSVHFQNQVTIRSF